MPPLQLPAPSTPITEPAKAPALWVELEYPDGQQQTVKGFAMAWTKEAVYAQWIEFSRARTAWVRPDQCTRREIPVRNRPASDPDRTTVETGLSFGARQSVFRGPPSA